MASFPPPPAGAYGPPPQGEPPTSNRRQIGLVAALVAVAALAAGGVYVATRSDDAGHVLPRESAATTDAPISTDSVSPITTPQTIAPPQTTTTTPTTEAPPDTTTGAVPQGALELGLGVYIPLSAGWEITDNGVAPTISDGTTSISLQALARTPGEDPAALMQEYVDTFDSDYDAVSYNPSIQFTRLEGPLPVDAYGVTYRIYNANQDDGISTTGTSTVFVRGDGLSVIYDVFSSDDVLSIDDAMYNAFLQSMIDAPALGDAVALVAREPFRVTSAHEYVSVFGLAGFTLTPSWKAFVRPDGNPLASNDDGDFEVRRFEAVGSVDGAVAAATYYQKSLYPNVTYDPVVVAEPNSVGEERRDIFWTGTLTDGTAIRGNFSVFFDPVSGNSLAIYEDWFGTGDNPYFAEFSFMFVTAAGSFPTI